MDLMLRRAACAIFLVLLGGARVLYSLSAKAHPPDEVTPTVNWGRHIPAYFTSSVWTIYVGFFVLAPDQLPWWDRWFEPSSLTVVVGWIAVGCMAAGLWLFWFSHHTIGKYWSIHVQLKESHQLITHGPYKYIRNPLYTAFFLGYLGTVLALHSWLLVAWFPVFVASYTVFAKEEERMLEQAFGEEYQAYKRRSGMYLPSWKRG